MNNLNSLSSLVEDIYSSLSPLSKGEALQISEEEINNFGEAIKEVVRHWATPKSRDRNTLRMSNIGKPSRKHGLILNIKMMKVLKKNLISQ